MANNTSQTIEEFVELIKNSDFSQISYCHIPNDDNQQIVEALVSFFENCLRNGSRRHPLVAMAINDTSTSQEELYLLSLHKLKILGSALSYIRAIDEDVYAIFAKKLSRFRTYEQALFELQIGCILKNNDSEIEFYELENPTTACSADFRKKLDCGRNIWIDAFVRKRKKSFFDHFERDDRGAPIPKSQEEFDKILRDFVKTTCRTISKKRKRGIGANDIFLAVVRIWDGYSSGSINYQSLVNSLTRSDVIVIFKGVTGLYVGDKSAKDSIEIYYNGDNKFKDVEVDYINKLFS